MDTITHTVLGACTGQLIAGKHAGKKAMLIGALVNNMPDIDMLSTLWTSSAHGLLTHRGITHSFLFAALATPLLVTLFKRIWPSIILSRSRWYLLVSHGLLLHVMLDSCTTYGTGLFEPFSAARVSFNTLFIMDLIFMLPLLAGAIVLLSLKRDSRLRNRIAVAAICLSSVYLLCSVAIKLSLNSKISAELAASKIDYESFSSSPGPFTSFLWYIAVKRPDNFLLGFHSIFDEGWRFGLTEIKKQDELLKPAIGNEDVQYLLRFCKGYYCVRSKSDTLVFSDLRFGTNDFRIRKENFVFNFYVMPFNDGYRVQQAPFRNSDSAALKTLFRRISGERPSAQ